MTNSIKTSLTHNPKEKKKKSSLGGRKRGRQRVKPIVPRAGDPVWTLHRRFQNNGGLGEPESPAALRTGQDVRTGLCPRAPSSRSESSFFSHQTRSSDSQTIKTQTRVLKALKSSLFLVGITLILEQAVLKVTADTQSALNKSESRGQVLPERCGP